MKHMNKFKLSVVFGFLLLIPYLTVWAVDVTANINVNRGRPYYDFQNSQTYTSVSLTNTSAETITTPLQLVIDNITAPGVTVANADGVLPDGRSYFDYSGALGDGLLEPGETSSTKILRFNNPGRLRFNFTTVVLGELQVVNTAPTANAGPDQTAYLHDTVVLDGSASSDVDGDALTYNWTLTTRPTGSAATLSDPSLVNPSFVIDVAGTYVARLIVNDGAVDSAADTVTVITQNSPPTANAGANQSAVVGDTIVLDGSASSDLEGSVLSFSWSLISVPTDSHTILTGPLTVDPSLVPDLPGTYIVQLIVNDGSDDSAPATATLTVTGEALPPDPVTVAPPVDPTIPTSVYAATEFLYTGTTPIQTGVSQGTIQALRAAVLRGQVIDRNSVPIAGVKVTVLDHPEYGQTLTRLDGKFDMAVNGGGQLTIDYRKPGYLPVQRQVDAAWQDYSQLPEIIMIKADAKVTTVDLTAPGMKVAQGSEVTDSDGSRTATVLIPQGTSAEIILPDGSTQSVNELKIRATEYTVGATGPEAMPAVLPPTSAYTYAVGLTADEAIAKVAGKDVIFNQPVYFYVDNFLNFPAGVIVPSGYYDGDKGAWIPSDNGLVIAIVAETAGMADLDVNGDGIADSGTDLTSLGITDAERVQLASLYEPGQSLWRVPLTHLSTWDFNFPRKLADDAKPPKRKKPKDKDDPKPPEDNCSQSGSIIGCQEQVLGEELGVAGTPFKLRYSSARVRGRKSNRILNFSLTGDTIPASLQAVDITMRVRGKIYKERLPASPNLNYELVWDGLNAYGREVNGSSNVRVNLAYEYEGRYDITPQVFRSFGLAGLGYTYETFTALRTVVGFTQRFHTQFKYWNNEGEKLGGWTLDIHHAYDPFSKILYRGDGTEQSSERFSGPVIYSIAGDGSYGYGGDNGPAIDAVINHPTRIAVAADGSVYFADRDNQRIRRIDTAGIITTVAGNGNAGFSGDGGQATAAELNMPIGIAFDSRGNLFIADRNNNRIRRVDTNGIITTIAGSGVEAFGGDNGPAIDADLDRPTGVAVGPDDSLYISEMLSNRVRRIDAGGYINTVAGNGIAGYSGDGGPATLAQLNGPRDVAVDEMGNIYIADHDNQRVRKVRWDGVITTLAGTGAAGYNGDGISAQSAQLDGPRGVSVSASGVYIGEREGQRVRLVRPDGIITTIAGNGTQAFGGDSGLASNSQTWRPLDAAEGPDGDIYIADTLNSRIRKVRPMLPGPRLDDLSIPSADGKEFYTFDIWGKHLATYNALTGGLLYQFGYDPLGNLITITDGDGNVTTIERNGEVPIAIVSAYGQRTTLSLDANGYLASVTNPANETYQFTSTPDGLLTSLTDPNGHTTDYTYDALGRLTRADDAAGGWQTLERVDLANGYEVTHKTAMGRTIKYRVESFDNGNVQLTNTFANGTQNQTVYHIDGTQVTTQPDGSITTTEYGPDPRFGMQAPVMVSQTTTTPGGIVSTTSNTVTATLADPEDVLSLEKLTETKVVNGRAYSEVYDAATRTTTRTTPAGRVSSFVIDDAGRHTAEQAIDQGMFNYAYDAHGRLASITRGSGGSSRTTTQSYDANGYLNSITNPELIVLGFENDPVGRITQATLAGNRVTGYGYDARGNLTAVTPPLRPAHIYGYTDVNLVDTYQPPDIGIGNVATGYLYNLDKENTQISHPGGQSMNANYNTLGQLTSEVFPSRTLSYTYNSSGRIASIASSASNDLSFGYDGFLLTDQQWAGAAAPVVGSTQFSYNNDLNLSAISVNGTNSIGLVYDNDGLLIQAGALMLTRNAQTGLVDQSVLGNVTENDVYNQFGELEQQTATANASPLLDIVYTHDALGRVSGKSETIAGVTRNYVYHYDVYGQLEEVFIDGVKASSYAYDLNGNRLSYSDNVTTTSGSYDNQDRLVSYGTVDFSQDATGRRLGRVNTSNGETTTYVYDFVGNLTQVNLPDGRQIAYVMDATDRRVGKQINGVLVKGWLYQDHLNPVAEVDGSNNVVARFVYASKTHVPDYMIKGGATYRIISDKLGSVRLVVDSGTGAVAQRLDYDEYGVVVLDTNPGFQPFGFAGGLYDPDTHLVRFGERDYDAQTGRWLSKDPVQFAGGSTNLYVYVKNNPTSFIDPSGRVLTSPPGGAYVVPTGSKHGEGGMCIPPDALPPREPEPWCRNWKICVGKVWAKLCETFGNCAGPEPPPSGNSAPGVRG